MKQPFWIVNSLLLMLALLVAGFLYFSGATIPARESIEPAPYRPAAKKESSTVNISKIYEFDLFDTYQKDIMAAQPADYIASLPEPPAVVPLTVPEQPKTQFVDPLPITLKGIVVVRTDDTKNRAIIMDNRTNREATYKVGDVIEDAQLIRIFNNKVIFMRSNGQQEVLYLREKDAKGDPAYATLESWDSVITQAGPDTFTVNTAEFINRVQSLGQFVDMLELTTAYRQGVSVGCRVNNDGPGSLAAALGLSRTDLIVSVNGISAAETQNRLAIYKKLITLKTNDTVTVTVMRNGQEHELRYILQEVRQTRKQEIGLPKPTSDQLTPEQRKQLEKKHSFAPSLNELRSRERVNMMEKSKRPTQNVLSKLAE